MEVPDGGAPISPYVRADPHVWHWVGELPLVVEILVWFLSLPWMLALAVWESAWSDAARVLVVLAIAIAWALLSIPRPRPDRVEP